jgi:hypothetical protein
LQGGTGSVCTAPAPNTTKPAREIVMPSQRTMRTFTCAYCQREAQRSASARTHIFCSPACRDQGRASLCPCGSSRQEGERWHCWRCHALKPSDQCYPSSVDSTKPRTICKTCFAERRYRYRQDNFERVRLQDQQARAARKAADPEKFRRQSEAWVRKNPELALLIARCRVAVQDAVKRGILVRPDTCEQCGGPGPIEGAHADYSRRLDVRWLCRSCHRRWDRISPKSGAEQVRPTHLRWCPPDADWPGEDDDGR